MFSKLIWAPVSQNMVDFSPGQPKPVSDVIHCSNAGPLAMRVYLQRDGYRMSVRRLHLDAIHHAMSDLPWGLAGQTFDSRGEPLT